jgi:hypothetical protein
VRFLRHAMFPTARSTTTITIISSILIRYLLACGIAQKRRRSVWGDNPKVIILPEPGVSWINLRNQRYQGPEQHSRTLLKLP